MVVFLDVWKFKGMLKCDLVAHSRITRPMFIFYLCPRLPHLPFLASDRAAHLSSSLSSSCSPPLPTTALLRPLGFTGAPMVATFFPPSLAMVPPPLPGAVATAIAWAPKPPELLSPHLVVLSPPSQPLLSLCDLEKKGEA